MPETKVYSDDAKRISHEMTMHAVAKSQGWATFRLSDGSPVGHNAYPTRVEAVMSMRWDRDNILYLEIQPDGMTLREAEAVLTYARTLHNAGFRIPAPEFEFDASMPTFAWDRANQIRHLASGGKR